MSCTLYLTCHSHHASPITSYGEVGHRLSDLPQVREWIRERHFLARCVSDDFADVIEIEGCIGNAARFFHQHPDCVLGIRDENGRDYPECDADQWYELADAKTLQELQPPGSRLSEYRALETFEEYRLCARFARTPDSKWRPCASPKATP
ncbi:hypothetical protein ACLQ3K_25685 [Tsukamurella sp. DT100]|uniref:hypothetical protein n=1 Tax=Tsukamurella sp. DT100 TaxID=3393415 RepID=UPI003CF351A9